LRDQLDKHYATLDLPADACLATAVEPRQAKHVCGILCMATTPVNEQVLAHFPQLRVVSNFAVGFDNIDIDAATKRRILVCNTPGVLDAAVADLTIGLIISLSRDLVRGDAYVRDGS